MDDKNNMKKNKIRLLIIIVILVFLIVGGTLAAVMMRITNGNYVYKTTCFNIFYEHGEDITGTLLPSSKPNGGLFGQVTIGIDPSCGVDAKGKINLNVLSNDTGNEKFTQTVREHCADKTTLQTLTNYWDEASCAASSNGIWVTDGTALKYAVYNMEKSADVPISVGYVNKVGEPITVYGEFKLSLSTTFDIYIWLDGALADNSYKNLSFSGNISATAEQVMNMIEAPIIDDGMIPVVISDDGTVTTVFEDDSSWYNYDNQEWANMVLVNNSSRSTYLNTSGVTVTASDIMAYYVWIPRYKYKIWTTGVSSVGNEQSIDIQFEKWKDPYSNGTSVGQYRTHPAFWWDDDNDGKVDNDETLPGIWVGKFETTGNVTTPTILPNTTPLVNQTGSVQFTSSLKFAGGVLNTSTGGVTFSGNDTYGLTASTDSHMMKNSEWGAAAYLSHSEYGINKEVRINNYKNSTTLTGCGSINEDKGAMTDGSITCEITYGQAVDYPQSTTGNISGIFDMSGGVWDTVMGIYNKSIGSSGFSIMPDSKYYNNYTITDINSCTFVECGGHALFETYNWYRDGAALPSSSYPWIYRGGAAVHDLYAGLYYYSANSGPASVDFGFRSVLIPRYTYLVTFDGAGGTIASGTFSTKDISYGSVYGELPEISKEGYLFFGWYTEPEGGTKITKDTLMLLNTNHTLYARWGIESINININYSVNGGVIESVTGTNNWSVVDDLVYINESVLTDTKIGTNEFELFNYNDEEFMNISKSGYGVPEGEEWICLDGCSNIGKTYSQDEIYSIVDFCDVENGSCTVELGVNWGPLSEQVIVLSSYKSPDDNHSFITNNGNTDSAPYVGYYQYNNSSYNYVVKYKFTTTSEQSGNRVKVVINPLEHTTGGDANSLRFYIGESSSSHTDADVNSVYTGSLSKKSIDSTYTGYESYYLSFELSGKGDVEIKPNTTYYLWVFSSLKNSGESCTPGTVTYSKCSDRYRFDIGVFDAWVKIIINPND